MTCNLFIITLLGTWADNNTTINNGNKCDTELDLILIYVSWENLISALFFLRSARRITRNVIWTKSEVIMSSGSLILNNDKVVSNVIETAETKRV